MKYLFIIGIMLTALCSQEAKAQQIKSGGGGAFTIGYGYMDAAPLHNFVPAGTPEFRKDHLLIGGSGYAIINRLVLGGTGSGIIGDKISTDTLVYSTNGGYGTFDIGYLIVSSENLRVYPMLGVGGGGYGIQISNNRNVSKNEVVNNPGQEINISVGSFIFDASVNLNFIPSPKADKKEQNTYGGFMTGLRVGYLYSFPSSEWNYTGGKVTGGPDFNLGMFYVKLIIGGTGFSKNQ